MVLGSVRLAARARLGQTPEEWLGRARAAVSEYDRLINNASAIADPEARGEILMWIGRTDVPGSPAERYAAVRMDVGEAEVSGPVQIYAEDMARSRIMQLENAVADLSERVANALNSYGTLPAPGGAGSMTQAAGISTMCIIGGVALLGLIVVPLLVSN